MNRQSKRQEERGKRKEVRWLVLCADGTAAVGAFRGDLVQPLHLVGTHPRAASRTISGQHRLLREGFRWKGKRRNLFEPGLDFLGFLR
jgi:hypothetical protein